MMPFTTMLAIASGELDAAAASDWLSERLEPVP